MSELETVLGPPLYKPFDGAAIGSLFGALSGLLTGLALDSSLQNLNGGYYHLLTPFEIASLAFLGGALFGAIERYIRSPFSRLAVCLILSMLASICAENILFSYNRPVLVDILFPVSHMLFGYGCFKMFSDRVPGATFGVAGGIIVVALYYLYLAIFVPLGSLKA